MAITTADEFLALLQKSDLVTPEQRDEAQAAVREGDDAASLAKRLVESGLLTDWQAAELLAGRSSFFLGKYKLLRVLGREGVGAVFLGEHTGLARRVVLKTISPSAAGSLDRFLADARALATLDHPNIVHAYSVENEGDRFYLVMEFVEGQNLKQLVASQGRLDYGVAADYVRQAAEGLEHGHRHGVIHGEVRPSNLLLGANGAVKVVDMGISRVEEPNPGARNPKDVRLLASVDFLAPEQAPGRGDFDRRADIYSLGCTLYFLLTGQAPFPGGPLHERLMRHQSMRPKGIGEFRSDVPQGLIDVCAKMMAKKPGDRHQSAAEVSKALAEFPRPRRRAKPAQPLKKATAIVAEKPVASVETAPAAAAVDARTTAANEATSPTAEQEVFAASPVARRNPLATPRRKIVAGAACGVAMLLLLAGLLPWMFSSKTSEEDNADWTGVESAQGSAEPETSKTAAAGAPTRPRVPSQRSSEGGDESAAAFGFGAQNANPMEVELGTWYATDPLPVQSYAEASFPEQGVDLKAADAEGKPLWHELPDVFDGIPFQLPQPYDGKFATYLFRTIKAAKPTTLPAGFSSDDTLDVWFNGTKVIAAEVYRPVGMDTDRADLGLNVGENTLLLKVFSKGGAMAFFFDAHLADARPRDPSMEMPALAGDLATAAQPPVQATAIPGTALAPPGTAPAQGDAQAVASAAGTPAAQPAASQPAVSQPRKPPALNTTGALAMLSFDETSGTLFDLSGKNYHGVTRGNVAYNQPGKSGGAIGFDGAGGDVVLERSEDFDFSGDFTWTAWIKTTSDGTIICYTNPDGDCRQGVKFLHVRDGKLTFEVGWTGVLGTGATITDNQWHHVALTVQSNVDGEKDRAVLYVDGKPEGSKEDWKVDNHPEGNDFVLKIGRSNKNIRWDIFSGSIDGVTVWNRTLSEAEIAATSEPRHNPFAALGEAGNLEPFAKGAGPIALGKLSLPEGSKIAIALVGGRQAVRPPRLLAIDRDDKADQWLIYVQSDSRPTAARAGVARLAVRDAALLLKWEDDVTVDRANSLLVCGLNISVDGLTRFLPLIAPVETRPLVVSLETGSARAVLQPAVMPDRDRVRLRIVRLEGALPAPTFKPGQVIKSGEAADITFTEEGFPAFSFRVTFEAKMRPIVELTSHVDYQMAAMSPRIFRAREAEQFLSTLRIEHTRLTMELQRIPFNDGGKRNDLSNKLKPITDGIGELMQLGELCKRLRDQPPTVQFCMFAVIRENDTEYEIPLVRTVSAPKAAEPGGAVPAAAPAVEDAP
jgi:hypothetical protein